MIFIVLFFQRRLALPELSWISTMGICLIYNLYICINLFLKVLPITFSNLLLALADRILWGGRWLQDSHMLLIGTLVNTILWKYQIWHFIYLPTLLLISYTWWCASTGSRTNQILIIFFICYGIVIKRLL